MEARINSVQPSWHIFTEEEVIRIYGKRRGIEVFFKVCKSCLCLEKDCRSLSYDAMTMHVSIAFAWYMFLAVEQRETKDDRTIGEPFCLSLGGFPDICFAEAMRLLVSLFAARLQERMRGRYGNSCRDPLHHCHRCYHKTCENVYRCDVFYMEN